MEFVRYGKLKPIKQLGYSYGYKAFHSPPSVRGFYAMPYGYEELFLIGSIEETQGIKIPKKYDKNNNYKLDYNSIRKRFKPSKDVTIWSHIDIIPNNLVLNRDGSWVQTTLGTYIKFFNKFHFKNKAELMKWTKGDINAVYPFSKDAYEVFFDSIK